MKIASFNLDNIIECQRRFFLNFRMIITRGNHLSKQENPEGYHTHILNGGKNNGNNHRLFTEAE